MPTLPTVFIVVVLGLGHAVALAGAGAAGYDPRIGERHPEFTLPDINTGKSVSLADFRGKKVLLIQFASW